MLNTYASKGRFQAIRLTEDNLGEVVRIVNELSPGWAFVAGGLLYAEPIFSLNPYGAGDWIVRDYRLYPAHSKEFEFFFEPTGEEGPSPWKIYRMRRRYQAIRLTEDSIEVAKKHSFSLQASYLGSPERCKMGDYLVRVLGDENACFAVPAHNFEGDFELVDEEEQC
jgi:hypothetical protein